MSSYAFEPSKAQKRLLQIIGWRGNTPLAHFYAPWSVKGCVNTAELDAAIRRVVAKQDALRTTFYTNAEGRTWAVVRDDAYEALARHPLTQEETFSEAVAQCTCHLFDLSQGPLWRAVLISRDHHTHVLLFVFHHLIIDGTSVGIFFRSLNQELALSSASIRTSPAPSPPECAEPAQPLAAQSCSNTQGAAQVFWSRLLSKLPSVQALPSIQADSTENFLDRDIASASTTCIRIDAVVQRALDSQAARLGVTPFTIYLAGLFQLFAQTTGEADHTVIVPFDGRPPNGKLSNVIGMFVNLLPIRLVETPSGPIHSVIEMLWPILVEASRLRSVSFKDVIDRYAPEHRRNRYSPLRRILVSYLHHGKAAHLTIPGAEVQPWADYGAASASYDLEIHILRVPNRLEFQFSTNGALSAQCLRGLAEHFARILPPDGAQASAQIR